MTPALTGLVSDAYRTGKLQALFAVTVFGIGFVVGFVLVIDSFRDRGTQSAYAAASACASPAAALNSEACKYHGQARLLSKARNERLEITVGFDSLSGRTFSASFPAGEEPSAVDLVVDAPVDVTLWDGQITEVAGKYTFFSPDDLAPASSLGGGLFFGLFGLVGLGLSSVLVRRAWRKR
ncbi:MAG TPA: hypothetical protein VGV88_11125 [Candidatus Dormibacteraeota bacterium]|nr:hypothetical protein [Candidatus Dormibacteraeota bacterium]